MLHRVTPARHGLIGATLLALLQFTLPASAAEESHPHHVAVTAGEAWHGSETAGFLGADYVYRFKNNFAAAVFVERVSGDFELLAYGVTAGYFFENGWKIGAGPGIEKKLVKNETLALFHVTTGYDWHINNWSIGPSATYDFIEDNSNTLYLGVSVGYGF
jgi:hypothetical protein